MTLESPYEAKATPKVFAVRAALFRQILPIVLKAPRLFLSV